MAARALRTDQHRVRHLGGLVVRERRPARHHLRRHQRQPGHLRILQEIHQLQKDVQRLQLEMRLLRKQVRRLPMIVDQRRLIEVHLRDQLAAELEEMRREGYAEGYTDGILRHRADDLS
ncbi:hypothetical protein [Salinispora arenicola]|uniref:hypothetical protein n=1 Tax=Salinispora arenicola TaxID=168697 RepID=UPI0004AE634F|nr:hypothetical protein [Salinispora arenicola]